MWDPCPVIARPARLEPGDLYILFCIYACMCVFVGVHWRCWMLLGIYTRPRKATRSMEQNIADYLRVLGDKTSIVYCVLAVRCSY